MAAVAGPTQEGSGKLKPVPQTLPSILVHRIGPSESVTDTAKSKQTLGEYRAVDRREPKP